MAKILEMPKLSPTMEEGVLAAWHKKEGDAIVVDDLLAEVETDKATMEFRAFDKGTLLKILVAAGDEGEARPARRDPRRPGRGRERARRKTRGAARSASRRTLAAHSRGRSDAARTTVAASAAEARKRRRRRRRRAPPDAHGPRRRRKIRRQGGVLDRAIADAEAGERGAAANGEGACSLRRYVRRLARDMGIDLPGATGSGPATAASCRRDLEALQERPIPTPGDAPRCRRTARAARPARRVARRAGARRARSAVRSR